MLFAPPPVSRLTALENRLRDEMPERLPLLACVRAVDRTLQRVGVLTAGDSLALRLPWWPLVMVTGTAGLGKSAFVADRLGHSHEAPAELRFTVFSYTPPIDADLDPRFPVDGLATGNTAPFTDIFRCVGLMNDCLKGAVVVDCPGFDGDAERRALVSIAPSIAGRADLVVAFLDARRADAAAFPETLAFLAGLDAGRRLIVLDHAEAPLNEDGGDPAAVAWQPILTGIGVTPQSVVVRRESAADAGVDPWIAAARSTAATRLPARLEAMAASLENDALPILEKWLRRWRRLVLLGDIVWLAVLAGIAGAVTESVGTAAVPAFVGWLFELRPDRLGGLIPLRMLIAVAVVLGLIGAGHWWLRAVVRRRIAAALPEAEGEARFNLRNAFRRATAPLRSLFASRPCGWNARTRRRLRKLCADMAASTSDTAAGRAAG